MKSKRGGKPYRLYSGKPINGVQKQIFGSNTHNSTKFEKQFCSLFGSAQILNAFVPTSF